MGHYQFDAYQALEALRGRYADFLIDTMSVPSGQLQEMLRKHWSAEGDDPFRLFAPLLVQPAFPFLPGTKLSELQTPSTAQRDPDRPLHPKTIALLHEAGLKYTLHQHQVESIREAAKGKTVVLSAGTGSGKTEAFLIPILDDLYWADERGEDDLAQPGVRAIVVYPLNALVNNQIDRIQSLLKRQSTLTFAYYTSRLRETYRRARGYYDARHIPPPPACQIIDRKTLRGIDTQEGRAAGPPHILVTNFSMLEYMLIRPLDRSIFLPERLFNAGRPRLRAVVLDEAHVYAGAQAAEIHMLLRRAAERFGTQLEMLQGFATSATLSQGAGEALARENLTEFAAGMFAKRSEQISCIIGDRHLPDEERAPRARQTPLVAPEQLPTGDLVPGSLRTLDFDENGSPCALVEDAELVQAAIASCEKLGLIDSEDRESIPNAIARSPAQVLQHVLSTHVEFCRFRRWFFRSERVRLPDLDDVATQIYGEGEPSHARRRAADAVLRLGALARAQHDRHPFVPSRMHAFVRAPQGVWVDPMPDAGTAEDWPWGRLFSSPPDPSGPEDKSRRLELLLCQRCGAPYLIAWETRDAWGEPVLNATEEQRSVPVALVANHEGGRQLPEGWGGMTVAVLPVQRPEGQRDLKIACARCKEEQVRLRPLQISARAALGSIIDGIYPHLGEFPPTADPSPPFRPGNGRRLLSFSDSRQGAARVACEVEDSHDIGVNRTLLWRSVSRYEEPVRVSELIEGLSGSPELRQRAAAAGLGRALLDDLAKLCVYQEFGRLPASANSLETLGLIEVCYPNAPARPPSVTCLNDTEWKDFLFIVLDDVRRRGATRAPTISAEGRDVQLDQLIPNTLGRVLTWSTGEDVDVDDEPSYRTDKISLVPGKHPERNRLIGFARKLTAETDTVTAEQLLEAVWSTLRKGAQDNTLRWLSVVDADGISGLRINLERLALRAHSHPAFIEPLTRKLHFRSVRGLSAELGGAEPLRAMTSEEREAWRLRHAIRRVQSDVLLGMHSVEHTAQVDVDALEEQEGKFRSGQSNLLASSTTMEMGVDLGGLTLVVMTNVPPAAANYWQRAGRAGRRTDGSSMALTLALARPHDQKVFLDTRGFLASPVTPPRVRLDTPPLLLRHVNALLLSSFLEQAVKAARQGNPMAAFGTVEEFIVRPASEQQHGLDEQFFDSTRPLGRAFVGWLRDLMADDPENERLQRLVSGTVLATWTIPELADACAKAFERAAARAGEDLRVIAAQREAEEAKGEGSADRAFLTSLNRQEHGLLCETLISYLARNDFLPRFGFPINVVHLETSWEVPRFENRGGGRGASASGDSESIVPELRMERSLDIALGEYAPGAEVIAGKRVHRIAGLVRNWMADDESAVTMRFFMQCAKCGHTEGRDAQPVECPVCGHPAVAQEAFLKQEQAAVRQRSKAKARGNTELDSAGELEPSPVRFYLEPSSFSVKLGSPPRRLKGDPERMPPARVVLASSPRVTMTTVVPDALFVGFAPESRLFVRSEGRLPNPNSEYGYGFAICQRCGRAEPESSWKGPVPMALRDHKQLRGLSICSQNNLWRNAILGTSGTVDALRVRLAGDFAPVWRGKVLDSFLLTVAVCLQQCAAARLQVDQRILRATVGTWSEPSVAGGEPQFGREVVLYDDSCSGMLDHLLDDLHGLFADMLTLLDKSTDEDFVRFDTQFLVTAGQIRLDLVRTHFDDKGRRALLQAPAFLKELGGSLLASSPHQAALQVIENDDDVVLTSQELSTDAFGRDGLLRLVHARTLREAGSVRILLGKLPDVANATPEQMALSAKLSSLVSDGVQLRLISPSDIEDLRASPWRVVSRRLGSPHALGAVCVERDGATTTPRMPDFGPGWLRGSIAVRAKAAAAAEMGARVAAWWDAGTKVTAGDLVPLPNAGIHFALIREGDTGDHNTLAPQLLSATLGRPLRELGQVKRLLYVDRYVRFRPLPMWQLARLLEAFDYAPAAQGCVAALEVNAKLTGGRSVEEFLADKRWDHELSRIEAKAFDAWCAAKAATAGLQLSVSARTWKEGGLRHPRKLLLEFSSGSSIRSLKVAFEHGLDWAQPVKGAGAWTERGLRASESFVLAVENHDLALELDDAGKSEWKQVFGAVPPSLGLP